MIPNTGQLNSQAIVNSIHSIVEKKNKITLSSIYKGILLEQTITPVAFDKNEIVFQAPNQKICVSLKQKAFLHSQGLPKTVIAQMKKLDTTTGKIFLTNFSFLETSWSDRNHERVQPKMPPQVVLQIKEARVAGALENISPVGIGLLVYKLPEASVPIDPENIIQMTFQLPNFPRFTMPGNIVSHYTLGKTLTRIGVRIYPSTSQIRQINNYIIARKAEILQELDIACIEMLEPPGSKDLYY